MQVNEGKSLRSLSLNSTGKPSTIQILASSDLTFTD
jgi:hypothetical protein